MTLILLDACATLPPQDDAASLFGGQTSRPVITALQLQSANVPNVQDALRRIRPLLFTYRASAAYAIRDQYRGYPVLYVDGQLQGGLDLLNTIPLNAVRSIQILSGNEGHALLGRFHAGGVVQVNTRR
jgi:hypothetical protein